MNHLSTVMTNQALRPIVAERHPAAYALALRAVEFVRAQHAEGPNPSRPLVLPEPSDAPILDTLPGPDGTSSKVTNCQRFERCLVTMKRTAAAVAMLAAVRDAVTPRPRRVRLVSPAAWWWTLDTVHASDEAAPRVRFRPPPALPFDGSRVSLLTPDGRGYEMHLQDDGTSSAAPWTLAGAPHPWRWDERTDPQAAARWWVIVYGAPSDAEGDATATVEAIRRAIETTAPAGVEVPNIITALDPASFDPLARPWPAPGMPDGTWGHGARLETACYWPGVPARPVE